MRTLHGRTAVRLLGPVALVLLLWPGFADAQQRRPRADRAQMERQLRERFQALVWRELGLDEAQGEALAGAVEEFREPRRELGQRQRQLERRLNSTGTLLSEDEAREVLDELVAVKEAEVELLVREQDRLLDLLSPPQLVRFYTLREQFGRRIRQLRENRPGGGPPGGPPGGAPPGGTLQDWPLLLH